MMNTFFHLTSAARALIRFIVEIHISKTSFKFKIEMLGEHEVETIRDSCTICIALIALVGQYREISTEECYIIVDTTEVECPCNEMSANEMT